MRKLPELKCLDMRSIEHQIFYFPEAKTRFKTLCELKCDTSIDSSYFYGLACICQYIQSIIIINVKTESNPGLVKLIEVQKNLKYFEWIDDFNDDDLADPYKDIFLELEKKGDILNHLVLFFQWIEGLDYHYKSMQNLLPKLHKIKTLIINDISFVDETLSKLLVYNDLETLNVSYITVYEASIIIENSGGRLKEVSLKPCRFLMCASNFSVDSLIFIRKIYENCPLIESLSLSFSLSKDHLTELENLLKVCQNLKSLLLIRTNMYEKGSEENLLKLLIKSAPNNLRELRFLIKFEFSLKVFEEFLKEWRGRPALSILTSDPIYENEDYKNLINNYKNEGIIKAFKVESIWNIENMNFKIQ
ncbi:21855_t:CDS:1 [Rhizophagus irregularis]|nr:21855_t:CDS:1 [Rhizophagus irregularis]